MVEKINSLQKKIKIQGYKATLVYPFLYSFRSSKKVFHVYGNIGDYDCIISRNRGEGETW
jgi:V8-like Glu-specific endopeptidase